MTDTELSTDRIGGVVLCGGHSRRMGRDKAWIDFQGEYLLARMIRLIQGVVGPVVVAARSGQSLPPLPEQVKVVHDVCEDFGPLAGMAAAFGALAGECEAAFVCACDHPLLRPDIMRALMAHMGSARAVVCRHDDTLQPLLGVYRLDTVDMLSRFVQRGERRVHLFAEECGAVVVETQSLRDVDPELESFLNLNDPRTLGDLDRR